ncbi:hypothetical protein HPB50_022416 [Hyalomma asiaticum]|uniref:Uncharacterized protein n=1 Tax=Hyalomma asiaticum TaxID=266040 RepID=A0ACB7T985_HYAAI|nr:hypothetical protein HPB50_022416 [Hyalomma asiaticum]
MNPTRSPINLQRKFPKTITRTVLIGDSQIKYLHTEFNPNCAGTPAFICQPGARIEDLHNLLQFVPATATTVILHVGTNDLASTKGSVVFTRYRSLLHAVFKKCPNVRRVFSTLILPRTTNRRRGNNNRAFVRKVNKEASFFNERLRQFCRRSMHIFYIDHGFEFLPARRVLAADGLHTSFEGTALLASHIKDVSFCEKRYTRSEWNEPTVAETAAAETTEIPLTSQEEFPRLPPPPPHPAPSLPHGPVTSGSTSRTNEFAATNASRNSRTKEFAATNVSRNSAAPSQSRKAPSQHNYSLRSIASSSCNSEE